MPDEVVREFPSQRLRDMKKVSWGAIWGGAMVTIGLEVLFISFGIFIAAAFGGSTEWTMAWYLVTMAVSFYGGARTAARLSDFAVRDISVMHGLCTWGLATLATLILGGVAGWAILGSVVSFPLNTAMLSWGPAIQWGGIAWGGVILSLITAYAGGASGVPSARMTVGQETPSAPTRLSA